MSAPLVTVVVIGRNEGARLGKCLRAVAAVECAGFTKEVIYVDSASSDGSPEFAAQLGARVISLKAARPTAALGRNAGWRAASGSLIFFLDGDTTPAPRFVADSLAEFDDSRVAVVWGNLRESFATRSVYLRVLDLDWIYPPGDTAFCGGNALFRRATLEATGGFDDTLIAGEEPELCRRISALNQRIVHVDRAMCGHDLAITRFSQYWRRASRSGHAFAEVSARFAHTGQPFWAAESRRNTRNALALTGLPLLGLVLSLLSRSLWPAILVFLALCALVLRTAWKARWKTGDRVALLLYGIHSHLQQIPIFFGQLRFWLNRRSGRRTALVEYKQP
jgi:cellulose synthase/poly-beta-1,6-N-acetylglucosamine synthase-like glycosyltransferase